MVVKTAATPYNGTISAGGYMQRITVSWDSSYSEDFLFKYVEDPAITKVYPRKTIMRYIHYTYFPLKASL